MECGLRTRRFFRWRVSSGIQWFCYLGFGLRYRWFYPPTSILLWCGRLRKPTHGNVSRYGLIAFASSLDQIGPITRDVTDAALVLNAIAGHDPKDSTSIPGERVDYTTALVNDVKNLKSVYQKNSWRWSYAEVRKAIDEAIETYKKLGCWKSLRFPLPSTKYALSAYYIIAEAAHEKRRNLVCS